MKIRLLKVSKIRSARVDVHRYKPYLKARCVKIYGLFLLAVPKFFAPKTSQSLKTRNFAYIYYVWHQRFKLYFGTTRVLEHSFERGRSLLKNLLSFELSSPLAKNDRIVAPV